jgi:nitrogen fixation protein FixH
MPLGTAERRLTGRTVLVCILTFFGVIISVNVTMMTLAIRTLPGTEVENAYQSGLAYNREISAAHAQQARGWHVAAHVARSPEGHGNIGVEAHDAGGAAVNGVTFTARLARPADSKADHAVTLVEREGGVYSGVAEGIAAGQWDLVIEADRGSERLFLSRNRLLLP